MSTYQALHQAWSPIYNARMVRVSMVDDTRQEYWTMIQSGGKGYRDRLEQALDVIEDAMKRGAEPGEVKQ